MANKEDDNLEKVLKNFELYKSLIDKISDETLRAGLKELVEERSERLATCPASGRTDYIGAFPGGLVWYSLEVLKTMKELNKLYKTNISTDSLIIAALFHDIGKIGDMSEDYYLPQDSQWHRDRGMLYEVNPKIVNGSVTARSLWWLVSKISLSEQEITAITSLQNLHNRTYSQLYNCGDLELVLQHAVQFVCAKMKGKTSL